MKANENSPTANADAASLVRDLLAVLEEVKALDPAWDASCDKRVADARAWLAKQSVSDSPPA